LKTTGSREDESCEKYRHRNHHGVVVEVIGPAEFRLGESRWKSVVYQRNGKLFVRTQGEFVNSFEPVLK
jgi:hypothetical protein